MPLKTVLTLLACMAGAAITHAASDAPVCENERSVATRKTDDLPASIIRTRVGRGIGNAVALFRFHRANDALAKVDGLVALLDGPRAEGLENAARAELTKSVKALRNCLAATEPAPLATTTIHAFGEDAPEGGARSSGRRGVHVDVEGIGIGRTGSDGTLQANVPSGTIHIRATEYPSNEGREDVTLSAGEFATVSVVMAEGKEPSEESDLVLEEALDGILPATTTSLTLVFVQDDRGVSIDRIEELEVSDVRGDAREDLEAFFAVTDGAMRATDVAGVFARIAARSRIGLPLSLRASAIDTEGRRHYGAVTFYVGRFSLAVTLAAPPSNPALPVSNIAVRVSVMGSEIAMRRISNADGRFELESLPDATVAFEAETVASGDYYYGDATVTLCADRSVTLVMRNVKDVVAGTRELILDPGMLPCPPVPRW